MTLKHPYATFESLEDRCLYAAQPIGEAGSLAFAQTDATAWQTVSLSRTYADPIVVASLGSNNDPEPAEVRVRNVTATGFEIQIDEWDYLDGVHGSETVNYFVVEAGRHTLDNGSEVVAGRTTRNHTSGTILFGGDSLTNPITLAQVTTEVGSATVTTRLSNVFDFGFTVKLQDEDGGSAAVSTESVDWIAIEIGNGSSQSTAFASFKTSNSVTDAAYPLTWPASFSTTPVVIAESQTSNGADNGHLRWIDASASGGNLFFEEEQAGDSEVSHATEVAGVFAIEPGVLSVFVNVEPNAIDDAYVLNEDTPLTVNAAAGVLANDSDEDGHTLAASVVTPPEVGNLTLDGGGSFVYTPPADFHGDVTFTYQVDDGFGGMDTANVTLNIRAINDSPVATDRDFTLSEDAELNTTLSFAATDVDDVTLTFSLLDAPTFGNATITANGTLSYDPNAEYSGSDELRYGVTDSSGATATGWVTLNVTAVNDLPTLVGPSEGQAGFNGVFLAELVVTDSDAAGVYRLTLEASNALIDFESSAAVSFLEGDGMADPRVVLEAEFGAVTSVLEALRLFVLREGATFSATLIDPADPSIPVVFNLPLEPSPPLPPISFSPSGTGSSGNASIRASMGSTKLEQNGGRALGIATLERFDGGSRGVIGPLISGPDRAALVAPLSSPMDMLAPLAGVFGVPVRGGAVAEDEAAGVEPRLSGVEDADDPWDWSSTERTETQGSPPTSTPAEGSPSEGEPVSRKRDAVWEMRSPAIWDAFAPQDRDVAGNAPATEAMTAAAGLAAGAAVLPWVLGPVTLREGGRSRKGAA